MHLSLITHSIISSSCFLHSQSAQPMMPEIETQCTTTLEIETKPTHTTEPQIIHPTDAKTHQNEAKNWALLLFSCFIMAVGSISTPMLTHLYFIHGGTRKWLLTLSQNLGFPVLFIPAIYQFIKSKEQGVSTSHFFMERNMFIHAALIGVVTGFASWLYVIGLAYVPVTTSTLLYASQLPFISIAAWFLVKQKFNPFSINSVVLMTLGSIILGIHTDKDRSANVTRTHYLLGFLMTLLSSLVIGVVTPWIELVYTKATRAVTVDVMIQFQIVTSVFGAIISLIGVLVSHDFQEMHREVKGFNLGRRMYYTILIINSVLIQITSLGMLGVILYGSSLFSGVFGAILLPLNQITGVIVYHESFSGDKGLALSLNLWGFVSYFYGEYKKNKKNEILPSTLKKANDPGTICKFTSV